MDTLCIILARGGSKGIPGKNLRPVAGIPLVAHSVLSAVAAGSISRVVVSTDDEEISVVAERYGGEVVRRPAEISGDKASSESALLHVLDHLAESEGYEPDLIVFLQPTSPYRDPGDIDGAVQTLIDSSADSVFTAFPEHFVGRWRVDEGGAASPVNFEPGKRPMRQDYPIEYLENGSIYVFRPWVLRDLGARMGGKIVPHPMSALGSIQVDDLADLELMDRLLQTRSITGRVPDLERIKLLVLDFDGTMTDNRVLVDQNGLESVWVSRSDGWGIARLREIGMGMVVLSTERNPVVATRCEKLGIGCMQGSDDKLSDLKKMAADRGLGPSEIAYLGNDVNDAECLEWVGTPIVVADAEDAVRPLAAYITTRPGGHGAVREVAELILASRNSARTREQ